MRLLLDTHTFLWWTADDERLSEDAKSAVGSGTNEVFVSAVNGWEIAIKSRLGKLPLPEAPNLFIARMVQHHAFSVLPIALTHVVQDYHLPAYHSDPFDRLLIAQAQLEKLTLVTNDALIKKYSVKTLW